MEELRFYSKYLALTAAIIGAIMYRNVKGTKAEYFLFAFWFFVILEFFGANFHRWFNKLNYPVYAFYIFALITFYLWWFRNLLGSIRRKKIVKIFIYTYITFSIVNAILIQDILKETPSYAYALGVIFLVTTICYYFIEVFNSEKVLKIRSFNYFWFSLGILIFHATYLPFYFASKFFLLGDVRLSSVVNFFLCAIMYTCFVIGFTRPKQSTNEHKLT